MVVVARLSATERGRSGALLVRRGSSVLSSQPDWWAAEMGFIPTPPWQHVLRRAREVCFGGLWVRFIPLAVSLGSWRLGRASCKNRFQTPHAGICAHPPLQSK